MGGSRALSLAAIDVLEGTGRALCWSRTEAERKASPVDRFAEDDVVRDRELRRHAGARQVPVDESTRTLDTVDPPARGPAPPDATQLIKRSHQLRTMPLSDLTDDDMRFLIDLGVAVDQLVPRALARLRSDALAHGDSYPVALLASVLCVDSAFWERHPDSDVSLRIITEDCEERLGLELGLREVIAGFRRDYSERRSSCWNGLTA